MNVWRKNFGSRYGKDELGRYDASTTGLVCQKFFYGGKDLNTQRECGGERDLDMIRRE